MVLLFVSSCLTRMIMVMSINALPSRLGASIAA